MMLNRGEMNLPRWWLAVIGHCRPLTGDDIILREAAWGCLAKTRTAQLVTDAWTADQHDSMSSCDHLVQLRSRARDAVRSADVPAGYRWVLNERELLMLPLTNSKHEAGRVAAPPHGGASARAEALHYDISVMGGPTALPFLLWEEVT